MRIAIPLPRASRGRPHRRRSGLMRMRFLVPMLAVAMLAGLVVSLTTPQRASAAVEDFQPATYNMQGGGAKWSTDIPQLARGYNVISLQEAGPLPPGRLSWTSRYLSGNQQWAGWRVQEYRWRPPGQSQDWFIYYLRTDFGGNRVNLAILSRSHADEVHVARPAFYGRNGLPTSRPALGITLGNTLFFSVHALASGGNDGAQLLQNMNAVAGTRTWAAMGDWNRAPNRLATRPGRYKYTVGGGAATQQSGGELDYMVANSRIAGYGGVLRGMSSDHYAVGFRRLAASAGVQLLNAHDDNFPLGMISAANGEQVVSGGTRRSWKFEPVGGGLYNIVNRSTGACWSDNLGRIITWPCNGAADQKFDLNSWADTGQLSIRPASRTSCVGDDTDFGYKSEIVTTMSCNKGESRFNFRFDYDPGPNAPLVVF